MSIDGALVTRLNAITAVTDLVSSRIYSVQAPHNIAAPYIVVQRISGAPEPGGGADPGDESGRFQVSAWATDFPGARALGAAIVGDGAGSALSRWTGTLDGTEVMGVFIDNTLDDVDTDTKQFRRLIDFVVWWNN